MAEQPIVPPTRKPVSTYPEASVGVVIFTELVNRDDTAYKANSPVKRGSLYSSMVGASQGVIDQYPNLYFLRERRFQNNDQLVIWDWATEPKAEDSYNAEVEYVANAVAYPSFTRVYTIRRDVFEQTPALTVGNSLTALIGVRITSPGDGYTNARGVIDGTDVDIQFVCAGGQLISAVIVNEGTGVFNSSEIQIIGDGRNGTATPITQPVGCVLTGQKKQELPDDDPMKNEFVRVIRTYETLPSVLHTDTRYDKDGALIIVSTKRNIANNIVEKDEILNDTWTQVTRKDVDDFIAEEITESRSCPGNVITDTKVDEDGMTITTTKQLIPTADLVTSEAITGGNWVKKYGQEVDDSTQIKTHVASNIVSWQIIESRPLPGNPIPSVGLDKDGFALEKARTLKQSSTITEQETLAAGVWTRTESERVSDLVSWEVVTARLIPGTDVPSSKITAKHETQNINSRLMSASAITPGASEAGGTITTIEANEVTELVSERVTTTEDFLDEALFSVSIENVIPQVFRALIPTRVESHVLSGLASQQNLAYAEFEHTERQLTELLYERRSTTLDHPTIPVTFIFEELTEEYGGAVVTRTLTLENVGTGTIDQGLLVIDSTLKPLGNGLEVKETATADVWTSLLGTHIDERYLIEIDIAKQTVAAGTTGGSSAGGNVITEVRPLDKWRSIQIVSTLNTDSLPGDVQWFSGMTYSFPPELSDAIIDWAYASCGCSFNYAANLKVNYNQYSGPVKTRITEQFYNGPPPDDVNIYQFFPQSHAFGFAWASACGDDDGNCRTLADAPHFYIPLCLHDNLTLSIGLNVWNFSATTPAALPSGDYIMLPPHVERWRFGVFRRVLTEVLVP